MECILHVNGSTDRDLEHEKVRGGGVVVVGVLDLTLFQICNK